MPSSEAAPFTPLGGSGSDPTFRAFGSPAPVPPASPAPEPDPRELAFEAGRAQGSAEARAGLAVVAGDVARVVEQIRAWREELRTRYTATLTEVALAIARKIAGETLAAEPARWTAIVDAAIRSLVDREQVTVRVPPRLAAVVQAHVPELVVADGAGEVRVVEDATLGDGGCRVESRMGDVECGIEAQLAAIAEALGVGRP